MQTPLLFFDLGGGEIFLIVLVIIMFFGSKKIPELARGLGKGIKEFKNAAQDIQREINDSSKDFGSIKDKVSVKKQVEELLKDSQKEAIPENDSPIINQPENIINRSEINSEKPSDIDIKENN